MPADTGKEQGGGRFRPGQSGNPNGRRAGAKNRVTALAQKLMEDSAEAVVTALLKAAREGDVSAAKVVLDADAEPVIVALIQAAKGGDVAAIELVLERVAPLPRNRPVQFATPAIETSADLGKAMGTILQAAAACPSRP